jgi:hypothetical protein
MIVSPLLVVEINADWNALNINHPKNAQTPAGPESLVNLTAMDIANKPGKAENTIFPGASKYFPKILTPLLWKIELSENMEPKPIMIPAIGNIEIGSINPCDSLPKKSLIFPLCSLFL